jgi:lysophospholipid acyltransferase (LPLAT)-like uncharacterized protein
VVAEQDDGCDEDHNIFPLGTNRPGRPLDLGCRPVHSRCLRNDVSFFRDEGRGSLVNRVVYHLALRFAPPLVGGYLRLVQKTSRVEVVNEDVWGRVRERWGGAIFALWHSRLLYPAYHFRHRGLQTIISRSRDGEIISRVVEGWGYHVVRGSSSRGGAEAFRGLLKQLQSGRDVVITPDGPRGPPEKVQPGVVALAKLTGYPIVPVSYDASRRILVRSWDRFLVPLPFARIQIVAGEPIVPEGDEETLRAEVARGIQPLTQAAEIAVRGGTTTTGR